MKTVGYTAFAIVLSLTIAMGSLLILQPFVSAISPPSISPNPVVIGQIVTINFGQASVTTYITKPDETSVYYKSDTKDMLQYTPDQIGTYNVTLVFSNSSTCTLTFDSVTWLPTPSPTPTATPTSTPNPPPSPTATSPTSIYTPTAIPSPTPASTASPSPTSAPTTIPATTEKGVTVNLTISGNVTSSQITNPTIATNQSSTTTTLLFTITGQSGTIGFGNITIPKSAISYGTIPTIKIDGEAAENQGYTQDTDNYYVWYITRFSTHEVSIVFSTGSSPQTQPIGIIPMIIIGVSVTLAVTAIGAFIILVKRGKN